MFASVHDSYWTHACDVDEMSAVLRDCFIRLHSRPLLEELKAGFEERYAGYVVRKNSFKRQNKSEIAAPENDPRQAMSKFAGTEVVAEEIITDLQKGLEDVSTVAAAGGLQPHTMNIQDIAAEYGASALPPLAVANDERMLRELKALEAREGHKDKTDEEMLAEEEKLFSRTEDLESGSEPVEGISGESAEPSPSADSGKELSLKSLVQLGRKRGKYNKGGSADGTKKRKGKPKNLQTLELRSPTCYELSKSFPEIPPRGDFDLEIIRDSPYFFS